MNAKIITITLLIVLSVSTVALSQKHERFDYEKIKVEKIAFLTDAIGLTSSEAEKFWPVYNEFEKKKFELMHQRRELEQSLENEVKNMSEAEYKELSRKLSSFPSEDGKISTEYNEKFLKILPARKVVLLYISEVKFRNQLLRNYRDKEKK